MKKSTGDYALLKQSALPEAYRKVLEVRKKIESNPHLSINRACKEVGISRSSYYKYRDAILPYRTETGQVRVHFLFLGERNVFVLSDIFTKLAEASFKLLDFSQMEGESGQILISLFLLSPSAERIQAFHDYLRSLRGVREILSVRMI